MITASGSCRGLPALPHRPSTSFDPMPLQRGIPPRNAALQHREARSRRLGLPRQCSALPLLGSTFVLLIGVP